MGAAGKQIVIPKDKAVFWMDGNGRWHNAHGPFENPKIIAFFHRHIRRDDGGYHVAQSHEGLVEKVYFRYEDTALFVFDVDPQPPVTLLLNTGRRMRLMPRKLAIGGDNLYMQTGDERIKFVDRALMKISRFIEPGDHGQYCIRVGGRRYRIPQTGAVRNAGRVSPPRDGEEQA